MRHSQLRALLIALAMVTLAGACQVRNLNTRPLPRVDEAEEAKKAEEAKQAEEAKKVAHHNNLYSTLWVQTAAEYRALAHQTYAQAQSALDAALRDRAKTAAPVEQTDRFNNLPPAVILDVDETVLDNSPYQARLVAEDKLFNPETWADWVREEKATAVPGALEFTLYAASKGVKVFYVTNRHTSLEEATRNNMARLGFPIDDQVDVFLMKKEEDDWGSAKGTRRAHIARQYRIVMLVGDNLGDFVDNYKTDVEARRGTVVENKEMWGTHWIVLPNPTYGSWDSALIDHNYRLPPNEASQKRFDALDLRR